MRTAADVASLYRTLGVDPAASPTDVRRAFRSLARRYHPDAGVQPSADRLDAVVRAYRSLGHLGALADPAPPPAPRHVDVYA